MFAIAGLIAAAAPIVIHLLNRRRFREIDWGAMDFLLEASSRSRSLLQLRDLLLLSLRTAAVALFGLAIARPFLAARSGAASGGGPVHAILVLDNSLSMGRERLGGTTLLDDARTRAKEFIDRLPLGSRMSVLPLCGSAGTVSFDAQRTKQDALEAIDAIGLVDRAGSAAVAVDLAAQAAALAPEVPDKRVVFIGDQQAVNWPTDASGLMTKAVPEMQVVSVVSEENALQGPGANGESNDNTWVESLYLEDGVADVEASATFTAVIRHEGSSPRPNVQISLAIDATEVATETVDLEPGQSREVTFVHRFDASPEPGRPTFASAMVSLPTDSLPEDDSRTMMVPVVAALPIVFIDQFGADGEQPSRNRYGETRHIRRLLAPVVSRADAGRQLVQVRHVRIDEVTKDLLEDARMVVIAGVRTPAPLVDLLRQFVVQGGQLVIAAGADFDADEWNREGWLDGRGILPLPLAGTIGTLPNEAGELKPFFLDWRTMKDDILFRLPGVPDEQLADLYGGPLFFKAVVSDASPATVNIARDAERDRVADVQKQRETLAKELADFASMESAGRLTQEDGSRMSLAREALQTVSPAWLVWATDETTDDASQQTPDSVAPRVLASFDNGQPYLVSRRLGRGDVLWVASGMVSPWNTLPKTNAMLMFDRLLRGMLADTLPDRTVDTVDTITIPLAPRDRHATLRLTRPNGREESLPIEALGGDAYGILLRDLTQRGFYTVTATKPEQREASQRTAPLWRLSIAANGPSRESQPQVLDASSFAARLKNAEGIRWIGPGETISVEGARIGGQNSWWWLLMGMLACLIAEWFVLAMPHRHIASQSTPGRSDAASIQNTSAGSSMPATV